VAAQPSPKRLKGTSLGEGWAGHPCFFFKTKLAVGNLAVKPASLKLTLR